MRLSKLKGLTEDVDHIPNDKWKFASEKFVQTIHKYKRENIFYKKIIIPEGTIHSTIMKEDHRP